MKIDTIFFANLSEIAKPLIKLMNKKKSEIEIMEDHYLCSRFIFFNEDKYLLVTPFQLNNDFSKYATQLLKIKNFINLSPKKIHDSLSEAVFEEKNLLKQIIKIIKTNPTIKIVSYAVTPEFTKLIDYLKSIKLKFGTPEMSGFGNEWTGPFFDSKSGFRQGVNYVGGNFPEMPEGIICDSLEEVKAWAEYFLLKENSGCVIKSNRGLAGAGLKIIKKNEIQNNNVKEYLDRILTEKYWSQDVVVVERFIESDEKICGGFPNIEMKINSEGVETKYFCGMRVTDKGEFRGVEMGKKAVPLFVKRILRRSAVKYGQFLQKAGYRGFYEIDWIVDKEKNLFPVEANLRRTGGTHVYEAAIRLLGDDFQKKYYITAVNVQSINKTFNLDFKGIKGQLKSVLYPIHNQKRGVIITIAPRSVYGKIGYMVIGFDKKDALAIENEFLELI